MRNLLMLLMLGAIFLGACSQDDFFDKLRKETPPHVVLKTLTYYGTPIVNLEFQQYLARDYTNQIDTGSILLKVRNLDAQPIDSLEITLFLYEQESRTSNDLAQAKKTTFLIANLVDSTVLPLFKTVTTLKTAEHIEVFCTQYNRQNSWSGYYIGQVEAFDTVSTATLLGAGSVYGVITADNKLDFRLPQSPLSTQQIRGVFTTDFSAFVGTGYTDSGDTTAQFSLDTLTRINADNIQISWIHHPRNAADPVDSLNFTSFN
ncbi:MULTISPECIES: hypothetical protein [unclassified Aureispira]|uniref:hypothetical protein n=1 Tax=unclassified Aureispira TaxID=2649989 RepID=UPI000698A60E|nr:MULTISPECIES: hypothetical protein [unclassified Aureispira]WMX12698.1 hypothetical protein QP953_17845 [Aureispira sp. CCB-E]